MFCYTTYVLDFLSDQALLEMVVRLTPDSPTLLIYASIYLEMWKTVANIRVMYPENIFSDSHTQKKILTEQESTSFQRLPQALLYCSMDSSNYSLLTHYDYMHRLAEFETSGNKSRTRDKTCFYPPVLYKFSFWELKQIMKKISKYYKKQKWKSWFVNTKKVPRKQP